MVQGDVTLEPPPEVPKPLPGNPLARLMPVAMLVAAGGMMALYFTSGGGSMSRGPMFMFFPVMMVVSILGSLAYGTRGANQTTQLNDGRRDYLDYLDTLDRTIAETAADQHRSLHWSHPDPEVLWTWWVAGACGSAESTILTSARSGSAAASSHCPQRSWRPSRDWTR